MRGDDITTPYYSNSEAIMPCMHELKVNVHAAHCSPDSIPKSCARKLELVVLLEHLHVLEVQGSALLMVWLC